MKANVHDTTEIEVLESTIKFNEGVIIGENHTGKLSKKIESIMQVSTSCVTARQSFWQLSRPTRMITRITYSNHL